jgi:MYXO-CTERM domain-containing protein
MGSLRDRVWRRGLGALALILTGAGGQARAQVGSDWVQYTPPSTIQLDGANGIETSPGSTTSVSNAGASYTNEGGIETFTLTNPISNRAERRMQNDYTSGRRQFEGEVRVSPPTNDESVTQVFGGTSGATTQMIRAYDVDNGTLRKVPGSVVLASGIYGTWVKINVVHDVGANNVKTYVNGKLLATGDGEAPASWYTKYGCYGSLRTPSAKVEWRNVKHFRDGTNPPGGGEGGDSGATPDAGTSDGSMTAEAGGTGDASGGGTQDAGTGAGGGSGGEGGGGSGTGGVSGTGGSGSGGADPRGSGGRSGGGGAPPVAPPDPKAADGGCGCRLADPESPAPWWTLGLLATTLLVRRQRRRR